MQRIPHGVTDQYIYFFAVDSTDLKTPETGLSSFTVRRSRNGNASAAFTTPTINETDVTNMPGWYELLMDEDTSLDAGDQSQIMALHITQASMAPAKLVVEIYRPDVTAGETLTVASGIGQASVQSIANNAITAAALAADAGTEIAAAVWDRLTSALTTVGSAGKLLVDNLNATVSSRASQTTLDAVDDFVDTEITDIRNRLPAALVSGRMDSSVGAMAADVMTAAAAASDLTTELQTGLATASSITTLSGKVDVIDDFLDTEIVAIKNKTDLIPAAPAAVGDIPTANQNADAFLDRSAGVETGLTPRQWFRVAASALFGKSSGLATTTAVYRDVGDTKDRITATVDADGNRTAVTRDGA